MPRDRTTRRVESNRNRRTTRVRARRGRSGGRGDHADSDRTRISVRFRSRLPTLSDYDRGAHEWTESYVHASEGYEIGVSACRGLEGLAPDDVEEIIEEYMREQHTPGANPGRPPAPELPPGSGPGHQVEVPDDVVAWHWRLEDADGAVLDRATRSATMGSTACGATLTAPETGTYRIHLRLELETGEETARKSVTIRDRLVVSVGDSYASGQGVPDRAGQPVFANEVRGCEMAADPVWLEPMAHRSLESAPFRAAAAVENRTEGDLVTFVSVASSGAEIERGLLDPQHDWQAGGQLEEVARTVGHRPIDTLLVSIGGNDVGFSTGLKSLAADPLDWFREAVESDTAAAIRELRGAYDRLAGAIDDLDPESVLLTEYPTAHFDRGGGRVGDGCGVFEGISHNDAVAIKRLGQQLNDAVRDAAERHRWAYVGNVAHQFQGHGYCADQSYFVGFTESCDTQGDIQGTMHPNREGLRVAGQCIARELRRSALPPRPKVRDHRRGGTRRRRNRFRRGQVRRRRGRSSRK